NGMEKCAHVQTTDAKISQSTSTNMSDLLPVVFIVVAFMLLFGYRHIYVQAHPRYSSLKIPGTLPIFLQFRKLIIYHPFYFSFFLLIKPSIDTISIAFLRQSGGCPI